jgi:hypothetical protein
VCFEARHGKPDESRKRCDVHNLDGPQPKPMSFKVAFDPRSQSIALLTRQQSRKVLHHSRISIQRCKWLMIGCTPSAET